MMDRPIFYDASGRRRRLTLPAIAIALIAILIAATAFALTIVERTLLGNPLANAAGIGRTEAGLR
jgi:hypothetical protein